MLPKFLNLLLIMDGSIINIKPHNFIFITREGCKDPGARVRCYGYAERVKALGLDARVFSLVDNIGAKSGMGDAKFTLGEKLNCSYRALRILSNEERSSVFIVNRFNYHAIPAWLVSMVKNIPFIFDMDDWETREGPGSTAEHLTRFFAKKSVFCIAGGRYLKEYLLQFNKKVYYIPTAVDTDIFKPSPHIEKEDFIFSWHGSVNRIEIIEYLKFIIECFLSLYEKCPVIKLHIAGDGIFGKELIRLIENYKCDKIIYSGWLDCDSIPLYLDNVDCGLVPLLDKTRFNLSKSPVKLFEYMAKEKPVVASNVGEADFIIKDGYNGFLAASKNEFVAKMEQIVKNKVLAADMGVNARKTIEKEYSLSALSEKVADILQNFFSYNVDFLK